MRRFFLLCFICLLSASLFAGGGSESTSGGASADGKIHLTAYMQIDPTLSQYEGHNKIMEAFAEAYPDIVIEPEYASGESFHQKFQAMAASREIPDIFTCYGGARSHYITQLGLVMDLKENYLTDEVMAEYSSATWAEQGSNGEYWMIPPSLSVCHVVYANTAIMEELGLTFPETYEEWKEQIQIARDAGYYLISIGNADPWVMNSWVLSLLLDRLGGPEWFMDAANGENGASFTDEPMIRSLEIIKEMTDLGMFSPGVNQMSNTEADQEFYQGKSVYLIDAGWRTSGMETDLPLEMQESIEMYVFPAIDGEVTHGTSTATVSEGFGINARLAGTEKADAAWTFIRFYTGEEGAKIRAQYGEVPSYTLDLSTVNLGVMQSKYAEFQAVHEMGYVFDSIMGAEGCAILNSDIQAMMLGNIQPEEVAAKYEAFVANNERF